MAAVARLPLMGRSTMLPQCLSPAKQSRAVSGSKRERSPDPLAELTAKRVKAFASSAVAHDEDREKKKAEREQAKIEFKEKYTKAFPKFKFYFDTDTTESASMTALRDELELKINRLGGSVEDFFSREITHLVTNRTMSGSPGNKENTQSKPVRPPVPLKSPIKLKGRARDEPSANTSYDLIMKAQKFGLKIWTMAKLESVVDRCLGLDGPSRALMKEPTAPNAINPQRSLSRLLASEKLNGTSERDPSQKRHDFRYFARGSYFLLVEDLRQELATIAAHEYVLPKSRNGHIKPPWPVLHCHPLARGPFIEFDEKEKRRWEKLQRAEAEKAKGKEKSDKRARAIRIEMLKRGPEAHLQATNGGDLRRCASMNNIRRRASHPFDAAANKADLEGDEYENESACASGFLASGATTGYIAASGNSVGITSTTGTTSTSGMALDSLRMPPSLRGRQQVTTSRRILAGDDKPQETGRTAPMGPPDTIPKRATMLRKSRSTNTMHLPKREEGVKPGYCESCRIKFDNFKLHIRTAKHRKFAANDDNFVLLDYVLRRVRRRTLEEVRQEHLEREARRRERGSDAPQSTSSPSPYDMLEDPELVEEDEELTNGDVMPADERNLDYIDLDDDS